jgi:hypothetical protein
VQKGTRAALIPVVTTQIPFKDLIRELFGATH